LYWQMPVLAMVAATAYNTAKGQLVRAILFPKPAKLDFERKMYYFMFNLLLYLLAAIIATIVIQRKTVRLKRKSEPDARCKPSRATLCLRP
jgi:magnesium-transporting ATPase (P-type)